MEEKNVKMEVEDVAILAVAAGADGDDGGAGAEVKVEWPEEAEGEFSEAEDSDYSGPEEDRGLYKPLPKSERVRLGISGAEGAAIGVHAQAREKETFLCTLCQVQLSSRHTMRSHALGTRHAKAVQEEEWDWLPGDAGSKCYIVQIPNPEELRKKVPLRLEAKLLTGNEPVVGLRAVVQFETITDKEVEPFYTCSLCGTNGEANHMVNHLVKNKHKQAFIEHLHPRNPRYVRLDTEREEVFTRLVELYDERPFLRRCRVGLCLKYESDLMFPNWPHGRAPWSLERGGDGVAPANAHASVGGMGGIDWASVKDNPEFSIWRNCKEELDASME